MEISTMQRMVDELNGSGRFRGEIRMVAGECDFELRTILTDGSFSLLYTNKAEEVALFLRGMSAALDNLRG